MSKEIEQKKKLQEFIRDKWSREERCKIISLGNNCECPLCLLDNLTKSLPAQDEQCNSNHLNIDDLLSEFKRQGFNTENWDGEEGAEKAIVDGVRNHIANLTPAQDDKQDELSEIASKIKAKNL